MYIQIPREDNLCGTKGKLVEREQTCNCCKLEEIVVVVK